MRAPASPPSTSSAPVEIGDDPAAQRPTPPRATGRPRLTDHQLRWLDDVAYVELEERSRVERETSELRRRRARAYELRLAKAGAPAVG